MRDCNTRHHAIDPSQPLPDNARIGPTVQEACADAPAREGTAVTHDSGTSLSLLQRIKNGDNSGWQRVVELYSPLARHWCRRWGIEGADSDDVLQEVFRSAAESIATFRREGEKDTFRGWLRGITRHRILAFFRNRDLRQAAVGGSDGQQRLHE